MPTFAFLAALSLSFLSSLTSAQSASPVSVQLSYESCCPYCQAFITGTFKTAWGTDGFTNITTIEFLPFGNAEEKYDSKTGYYNYTCQHGENECRGNLVESCFMGLMNFSVPDYMDFVIAFEESLSSDNCRKNAFDVAQELSPTYGIPWDTLHDCIDSKQGNDFQHTIASDTPSDHDYVPWIVVNDVHNNAEQNECQDDMLACVCERYKGSSPACDSYRKDVSTQRTYKKDKVEQHK